MKRERGGRWYSDQLGRTVPAYNNYIGHKSNRIVTTTVSLYSLTEKKTPTITLKAILHLDMYSMVPLLYFGVDSVIYFQTKSQVRSLL